MSSTHVTAPDQQGIAQSGMPEAVPTAGNLRPARCDVVQSGEHAKLDLAGAWTIESATELADTFLQTTLEGLREARTVTLDLAKMRGFDTAGAFFVHRLILELERRGASTSFLNEPGGFMPLLDEVRLCDQPADPHTHSVGSLSDALAEIGESVERAGQDVSDSMSIFGRIMAGFGRAIFAPKNLRITSIVHHMEHSGLRAVPIIALMSFLIGAIIAQQGAYQLRAFGGEIFVVDLVGILVLREIGVLLTAIMVAGRSGSAYTAEIGSMKMREEIDAMQIIGLSPIEVLALPRVTALMIVLPLLTFISGIMCIFGAMIVAMLYSSIQPEIFMSRLQEAVGMSDILVGFIKAPFMALVIGLVACVEGLRVEGSTESLGQQTTASVVKSIFMVIVMDGVFAVYFAAIGF